MLSAGGREANQASLPLAAERHLRGDSARGPHGPEPPTGLYYGSAEDDVTKFCPRHFYEMHFGPNAPYRLIDAPEGRPLDQRRTA